MPDTYDPTRDGYDPARYRKWARERGLMPLPPSFYDVWHGIWRDVAKVVGVKKPATARLYFLDRCGGESSR